MKPADVIPAFLPTLCIYIAMFFCTVLYCMVMLAPFLFGRIFFSRTRMGDFCRSLILSYGKWIIHVAIRPWIRVRCEGRETCRTSILVFNHRSASDPFLVAMLDCNVIQLVNGWPMRLPLFGFFARLSGYMDMTKTSYEMLRDHVRIMLDAGVSVVVFPEGTRSGSRDMNQFRSGVFKVAHELGVPLTPCCIVGNENLPDRNFRFGVGTIRMRVLPELSGEQCRKFKNVYLLKQHVRSLLADEIKRMEQD